MPMLDLKKKNRLLKARCQERRANGICTQCGLPSQWKFVQDRSKLYSTEAMKLSKFKYYRLCDDCRAR